MDNIERILIVESRSILASYLLPPALRNPAFRERGNQELYNSFEPLVQEP